MTKTVTLMAAAFSASIMLVGVAQADRAPGPQLERLGEGSSGNTILEGNATLLIDITGLLPTQNVAFPPNPANPHDQVFLGVGSLITGLSWNVTLNVQSPAWYSDYRFAALNGAGAGVLLRPVNIDNSGPGPQNGTGSVKYSDAGLPDTVLDDGWFHWQIYTGFPGDAHGLLDVSGWIEVQYIAVPAPGALALLGVAGLLGVRRRRN